VLHSKGSRTQKRPFSNSQTQKKRCCPHRLPPPPRATLLPASLPPPPSHHRRDDAPPKLARGGSGHLDPIGGGPKGSNRWRLPSSPSLDLTPSGPPTPWSSCSVAHHVLGCWLISLPEYTRGGRRRRHGYPQPLPPPPSPEESVPPAMESSREARQRSLRQRQCAVASPHPARARICRRLPAAARSPPAPHQRLHVAISAGAADLHQPEKEILTCITARLHRKMHGWFGSPVGGRFGDAKLLCRPKMSLGLLLHPLLEIV
jgi:hypothetical protein